MGTIVPLSRARVSDSFGGKAAQLARASDVRDVHVPAGFVLGADVFRELVERVLPAAQWPERLVRGPADERRGDRLVAIRATLAASEFDPMTWEKIVAAYRDLGQGMVAVRSSALHEDGDLATAAGLQETRLGVQGEQALGDAIRACLGSIYGERALEYLARLQTGVPIAVAVLVQRMVRADTAGVLFTVDPVNTGAGWMVVEAAVGLGTSVVDGSITPDVFRIERASGRTVAASIGRKRSAVRVGSAGLETEELSALVAERAALTDEQLERLAKVGREIEAASGAARDIEWAFEGDALWVLQSRPIVGTQRSGGERATWVWSNVNVGEALPGVATPLTWSIASAFSDLGFRRAFGALGCTVPADADLVGQFHGRIYLNLTQFVRIASQVPFLDPKLLLEFGGGGGLEMVRRQTDVSAWPRFALRAPAVAVRIVVENTGMDKRLAEFERYFSDERRAFESAGLFGCTQRELAQWLERLEVLLDRTGALMLTCASGSLSAIIGTRAVLSAFMPADAPRLERELLTGITDLESAAPGIALVHMAELVRREPLVREKIEAQDLPSLDVGALPAGPTRRAFEAFLRAYGYRASREAELSTPRWREAPQVLFAALRAQLTQTEMGTLARVERQHELQAEAERIVLARLPGPARSAFRHLLARARKFVRLRERLRARVTEVLGFFRGLALETSDRVARRDPSVGDDSAFFLHLGELRAFLQSDIVDVGALVRARRADFARDRARPDPPSVFVGAPPPVAPLTAATSDRLEGIAASPGTVTGSVRIVRVATEGACLRAGEVLVVSVADVGWTPLFLSAAAVVTELGGALSHASLVAREYGVPAVVNVQGATRILATGDTVRVDGDRGIVDILARADDRGSHS